MNIKTKIISILVASFLSLSALAEQYQEVTGITIDGLIHVSAQTVTDALSIKKNEMLSQEKIAESINALYKTGFFEDIKITQSHGLVNVVLKEQMYVNHVEIKGIKLVPEEKVLEMQKALNITKGNLYNDANVNAFIVSLKQAYDTLGYYNASITVDKQTKEHHTLNLSIVVKEGSQARIRQINIIGNRVFDDNTLLSLLTLHKTNFWSMITSSDKYAKQKMDADLETLRSFYMDHGFVNVSIDSITVSITPDKKNIYISIYVTENSAYKISSVAVDIAEKDLLEDIQKLIRTKVGDSFKRSQLLDDVTEIKKLLGNHGYASAKITPVPKMDNKTHQVGITYRIEPGKKVYIRRINFFGNSVTDTKVLRRELRQYEASEFSLAAIKESERRLANIKWITDVKMMMDPVAGQDDLVDLNYNLKEKSSAQIMAEASYSTMTGFIYRFSLLQDNFLGTGQSASISTSHSKSSSSFNIGYTNPYLTSSGLSQHIGIYRTETKPGRIEQSDYTRNMTGASLGFGYPLSDYSRIFYGMSYEYSNLIGGADPATEIEKFVNNHGTKFSHVQLSFGINYNNYDNAYWPTQGMNTGFNVKYNVPMTEKSLNYYKSMWSLNWYTPFVNHLIFNANASVAYGDGLGDTESLPFYEHYYAGGIGSIAGYDAYSLGPTDSKNRSYGGNLQTLASLNLIFPNNLGDNVRTAFFVNGGNVFDGGIELDEIRYSMGLSLTWKSIMGPLEFVLAKPINDKVGDRTRTFDFTIGFGF